LLFIQESGVKGGMPAVGRNGNGTQENGVYYRVTEQKRIYFNQIKRTRTSH